MSQGQGPSVPVITVQLVHIEGPLKGQIQEFTDPVITIGRSPDCSVTFPKELKVISRKHAEIRREGNRFKLIDHSTNGTFVQGRRVEEVYLKDGDVITFTEGGPKVSFLSVVQETPRQAAPAAPPVEEPVKKPSAAPAAAPPGGGSAGPVTITIQWGAARKAFRQPSIRLGSDPSCDLSTDLPGVAPHHLEIRYEQGNVWAKDLTGEARTLLNGMPLTQSTVLRAGDSLKLTPEGPVLEYTGDARFVRREAPKMEVPPSEPPPAHGPDLSHAPPYSATGSEPPKPPFGRMPPVPTGIPMWVWVAAGSAILVALIIYLIIQWTG